MPGRIDQAPMYWEEGIWLKINIFLINPQGWWILFDHIKPDLQYGKYGRGKEREGGRERIGFSRGTEKLVEQFDLTFVLEQSVMRFSPLNSASME